MTSKTVVYTTEHSIADQKVHEWFEEIKEQNVIYFSNSIQLVKLRLEHLKGNIVIDEIQLEEDVIHILEDGSFSYFPQNFFEYSFEMICEISEIQEGMT